MKQTKQVGDGYVMPETSLNFNINKNGKIKASGTDGQTKQVELPEEVRSQPSRLGKSTLVTNQFLVACKTEQSAKYEHPDYVCFSRTAWEEQQKQAAQAQQEAVEREREKWIRAVGEMEKPSEQRRANIQVERNTLRIEIFDKAGIYKKEIKKALQKEQE